MVSLAKEGRILIRLPRSYPSQALGWSLAHSLIRRQIDGRIVLPYVVSGEDITPPKSGLATSLPGSFAEVSSEAEYVKVLIIEEPSFHSRSKMKFLGEEISDFNGVVMVLTKSEDNISAVDDFVKDNGFKEYELAPVSFSETAFFLEKAFDMTAREAEAVAIRLDDTFRKFRLDAHPTYFAGLHEETLAALINANKRAELIQLAVSALLSLMVAADKSSPPLSRTTRERFLKSVVVEMARAHHVIDDARLLSLASTFLSEGLFPTPAPDFLTPFFDIGLLYRSNGAILFTHPYLESYLLAQALRDNPEVAKTYFDPAAERFNYYAFDLYCEMGPSADVVEHVMSYGHGVCASALEAYPGEHIYVDSEQRLTALHSPRQLMSLSGSLMAAADKLEKNQPDDEVRGEKQRLLDAKHYVNSEVGSRSPAKLEEAPDEIKKEFEILDALSRALALCATAVGSGSESLGGRNKVELAKLVLQTGGKFSDVWTRNRLRINFKDLRNDVLADKNIWKIVEQFGANHDQFETIKNDLQMYIHGFEINKMAEPMGRVLWQVSASAGVKVLAPVLDQGCRKRPG